MVDEGLEQPVIDVTQKDVGQCVYDSVDFDLLYHSAIQHR